MEFEWDAEKERATIEKHGISFNEARHIFDSPVLTRVDDRQDYSEVREISLGLLSSDTPLIVVVVVHTARSKKTRLISARKANRRERKVYYDYLERTLEEN